MQVSWLVVFHTILLTSLLKKTAALGCYFCSSRNGSDSTCHDPFHPQYDHYETQCQDGIYERVGLFPANFCIKVKGTAVDSKEEIVIRTCSLNNMDTQCGMFEFAVGKSGTPVLMEGCILTCDFDGCNHGNTLTTLLPLVGLLATVGLVAARRKHVG